MTCLQEEIVLDIIIWLQLERSQAIQVGGDNLLQPKSHSVQASSSWRWIEIELHLHTPQIHSFSQFSITTFSPFLLGSDTPSIMIFLGPREPLKPQDHSYVYRYTYVPYSSRTYLAHLCFLCCCNDYGAFMA